VSGETAPRIGFVGFGEAAQAFARGFREAGIAMATYCSGANNQPPYTQSFRDRAQSLGVSPVETLAELCSRSDLIFSAVTVSSALPVAASLAPELNGRHLLVDINASAPAVKRKTAEMVLARGSGYVDAAVMGAVSIYGHRVLIYASGPDAGRLHALATPHGMQIQVVGEQPGMAAAIKMLRSVVTKGMAELLAEAMMAAEKAGIADAAFRGICDPMDATTFSKFAVMCLTTDAIHAGRRAAEMEEVMETLREMGVAPLMAEATYRRLNWTAASGIREHLKGQVPSDWRAVLAYYRNLDTSE
jgi:3-hydroxyisobutyrate dehydrogenase-like beta-hydroxyacid dehydrogenase